MKKHLLQASVLAVCLGAAISANAESTAAPAQYEPTATPPAYEQRTPSTDAQRAPDAYPSQSTNGRQMWPRQATWADQTPPSGIDSTAYSQCHGLNANDYWDCVNSHDGGGGQ